MLASWPLSSMLSCPSTGIRRTSSINPRTNSNASRPFCGSRGELQARHAAAVNCSQIGVQQRLSFGRCLQLYGEPGVFSVQFPEPGIQRLGVCALHDGVNQTLDLTVDPLDSGLRLSFGRGRRHPSSENAGGRRCDNGESAPSRGPPNSPCATLRTASRLSAHAVPVPAREIQPLSIPQAA